MKKLDIDSIKKNYNILDIANRLGIQVNNKNVAKCINHKPDNNPSLSFNIEKNYCKCFSCNYTADIFKLVMDVLNYDFIQASNFITKDNFYSNYKLTTNLYKTDNIIETENTYSVIYKKFIEMLDNKDAIEYLTSRFLTRECVIEHSIKNVPVEFDKQKIIVENLLKQFDKFNLLGSGIINENNNLLYAFHRLIIPYFDINKNIVCVQGRLINSSQVKSKYLFNKNANRTLYNIHRLREWKHHTNIVICEGAIDALSYARFGVNAIAIPGSSIDLFKQDTMHLLENYNLIIATDNDKAGMAFIKKFYLKSNTNKIRIFNYKKFCNYFYKKEYKDINELLCNLHIENIQNICHVVRCRDGVFILDKGIAITEIEATLIKNENDLELLIESKKNIE